MAWRTSSKVEKYRQLPFKENGSFIRGKLWHCHFCELQLCESRPINMLLCQGLSELRECPMFLADLEGTQVPFG